MMSPEKLYAFMKPFGNFQKVWSTEHDLQSWERIAILSALWEARGNKTMAANYLRISPRTIDTKLEQYAEEAREHARREEARKQNDYDWQQRARGLAVVPSSHTGNGMESAFKVPEEQPVPVQESEEVQDMLPRETSKNRKKGRS